MNTKSIHHVSIRLTDERWIHISEEHCEMAGFRLDVLEVVAKPDKIYEGTQGEFLAIKAASHKKETWLVVVYRELSIEDGFIITAFFTKRIQSFHKRKLIYERSIEH